MRAASHAVCFERPGEPGCGGVLLYAFFFGLFVGGLFGLRMAKPLARGEVKV